MPFEHGERRVLDGGQAGRPDDLVKPRADGEFHPLEHVQQQRRGLAPWPGPRLLPLDGSADQVATGLRDAAGGCFSWVGLCRLAGRGRSW